MILERFPEIDLEKVRFLSRQTAGMFGDEIYRAVNEFKNDGVISERPKFRYRNPVTGEFPEREINPFSLKEMMKRVGFDVSSIPHFYSESFRDYEHAVKRLYYLLERYLPIIPLFLSPGFALLGLKKRVDPI